MTDETRLEYLERGRVALAMVEEAKQQLKSAHGVFSTILKEAKQAGATEVRWTLKQLRRDPLELQAEIIERNRMLQVAKIPVGVQLGLFEGQGETLAELLSQPDPGLPDPRPVATDMSRQERALEESLRQTVEHTQHLDIGPPKPGPDDEDEDEEDEEDQELPAEPEEQEVQGVKPGNEMLERSDDDANAFVMGKRAFRFKRTLDSNPFGDITSMHGAWIRGWKEGEATKE